MIKIEPIMLFGYRILSWLNSLKKSKLTKNLNSALVAHSNEYVFSGLTESNNKSS